MDIFILHFISLPILVFGGFKKKFSIFSSLCLFFDVVVVFLLIMFCTVTGLLTAILMVMSRCYLSDSHFQINAAPNTGPTGRRAHPSATATTRSAPSGAALVAAQQPSRHRLLRRVRSRHSDYALQPSPLRCFLRVPSTIPFHRVDKVVCDVTVGSVGEMNWVVVSPDCDAAGAVEAVEFLAAILGRECRERVEDGTPREVGE